MALKKKEKTKDCGQAVKVLAARLVHSHRQDRVTGELQQQCRLSGEVGVAVENEGKHGKAFLLPSWCTMVED